MGKGMEEEDMVLENVFEIIFNFFSFSFFSLKHKTHPCPNSSQFPFIYLLFHTSFLSTHPFSFFPP